ncbi:uncharacterized protein EHS24_003597 [Apiotrichum porosum]|uniref:Uncharacterized protein n=1 Tax=Apiotrichum porosum TaxID=105984 RepID=A0A427XEV9_9TREE|nr:uncharacterized protein EHS24_003597 [Apiotrichum porosum]RSH77287.1 hypothetical protein EHS24_003597 [Apiotrichum porosum]
MFGCPYRSLGQWAFFPTCDPTTHHPTVPTHDDCATTVNLTCIPLHALVFPILSLTLAWLLTARRTAYPPCSPLVLVALQCLPLLAGSAGGLVLILAAQRAPHAALSPLVLVIGLLGTVPLAVTMFGKVPSVVPITHQATPDTIGKDSSIVTNGFATGPAMHLHGESCPHLPHSSASSACSTLSKASTKTWPSSRNTNTPSSVDLTSPMGSADASMVCLLPLRSSLPNLDIVDSPSSVSTLSASSPLSAASYTPCTPSNTPASSAASVSTGSPSPIPHRTPTLELALEDEFVRLVVRSASVHHISTSASKIVNAATITTTSSVPDVAPRWPTEWPVYWEGAGLGSW